MASRCDESSRPLTDIAKYVGGSDHLPTNDHLQAAAQLAVAAATACTVL